MWTYDQRSGALSKEGEFVVDGYSGFGEGKDNPDQEQIHDIGPIPKGVYEIGPQHDTDTHGPHVMSLTPEPGTNTFGRDGFLIHGDSVEHPGAASHGCIILPRNVRDRQIEVLCEAAFTVASTE
jgi:Protein of unknown function (DUF2778)